MSGARVARRGFLGLVGAGVTTAALSACAGPTIVSGSAAASMNAERLDFSGVKPAKHVTFWTNHPGSSSAVEAALVKAFNESGAGIEATMVTAGASYDDVAQKFQTAQAGGEVPDVVIFSDVWWFRYFLAASIIPLDDVLGPAGIDGGKYVAGLWTDYRYGGRQWAVPYARSTPVFYWNRTAWQKAGLPDRAPATWAELEQWAPTLAAKTGMKAFQFGSPASYAGWTFQNNLWGTGGGWSVKGTFDIDCTSAASQGALGVIDSLVNRRQLAGVSSNSPTDDMAAGAAASTIDSTGSLVGTIAAAKGKFEVGVGPLPGGPANRTGVSPTGGAGLGIPRAISRERQLAAARFLAFMTNPANTVKFAEATGYVPVRTDADTAGLLAKTPQAAVAIRQLPSTRRQDWARVFLPGADDLMSQYCSKFLSQGVPVADAMRQLRPELQAIYESQVRGKTGI